jgi:hypothetical protein
VISIIAERFCFRNSPSELISAVNGEDELVWGQSGIRGRKEKFVRLDAYLEPLASLLLSIWFVSSSRGSSSNGGVSLFNIFIFWL